MKQRPLIFDLNAAPIELIMTIPGVTYAEALAIDAARRRRPLRAADELAGVAGVRAKTVPAVRAMQAAL
jgi:DNA uptake protein ComE-like DNA-binding protein